MNRTDRLYAIREELRRAGSRGRTAEQLAVTFEVSTRTIKRDIGTLQASGFPVWARTGRIGGYVVDAQATLTPVALTPAEVSGLALALAAGRHRPFHTEARAALVKILAVTPPLIGERIERLTQRVWVDHDDQQRPDSAASAITARIGDALAGQLTLSLHYTDSAGRETRRLVDPQLLAHTGGRWYLVAHCHIRDAIRWFQLDRVTAVHLTRQRSVDRPVEEMGTPPRSARPIAGLSSEPENRCRTSERAGESGGDERHRGEMNT